eukprot:112571-Rhodomonas_salina.2
MPAAFTSTLGVTPSNSIGAAAALAEDFKRALNASLSSIGGNQVMVERNRRLMGAEEVSTGDSTC